MVAHFVSTEAAFEIAVDALPKAYERMLTSVPRTAIRKMDGGELFQVDGAYIYI